MGKGQTGRVDYRLRADSLPFWVDVKVRSFGPRFVAVADLAGEKELGLGLSPSEAVASALAPLGPRAVRDLLRGLPRIDYSSSSSS
jgi:hypothetical protein